MTNYVWVLKNPTNSQNKYHKYKDCRKLKNIERYERIKLEEAEERGLELCGYCDGQDWSAFRAAREKETSVFD